ncbi:hypothetical protein EBI_25855 [Enterocytozoon bieneusi H348]|nr:hypothetical protein EBI_25855 [Enterocytozoon bieneusi H348]|eukprot:XP_001827957.1 hypothetical protein EBI_25855 [Enterocytozoon bieneusi H348]
MTFFNNIYITYNLIYNTWLFKKLEFNNVHSVNTFIMCFINIILLYIMVQLILAKLFITRYVINVKIYCINWSIFCIFILTYIMLCKIIYLISFKISLLKNINDKIKKATKENNKIQNIPNVKYNCTSEIISIPSQSNNASLIVKSLENKHKDIYKQKINSNFKFIILLPFTFYPVLKFISSFILIQNRYVLTLVISLSYFFIIQNINYNNIISRLIMFIMQFCSTMAIEWMIYYINKNNNIFIIIQKLFISSIMNNNK